MSVLIQRLKHPVVRALAAFTGPRMVYGWRNANGSWCEHTRVSTHSCFEGREGMVLQDHVFIGHFNRIDGSNGLQIDEGVQITNYVSMLTHSSHKAVRVMGRRYATDPNPLGYVRKATRIGAYSFIGPHSVIAPGVQMGKGVIVHGFSFVSGAVPDFAVVASREHGRRAEVVGDTRELDRALLQRYPELQSLYAHWAGDSHLHRALGNAPGAPLRSKARA